MQKINNKVLYFPVIIICLIIVYFHFKVSFPLFLTKQSDFFVLTTGSEKILSKKNPYKNLSFSHTKISPLAKKFAYPPLISFVFYPFLKIPYKSAKLMFLILNEFILFLSVVLLSVLFKIQKLYILFGWVICLIFFPVTATFAYGQLNIILLFLLLLFVKVKEKNNFIAGFILALAIFIKITPIIILFFLLFTKEKKLIFSTLGFLFILIIFSLIFFGFNLNLYYLKHLIKLTALNISNYPNQSLRGFLVRTLKANYISKVLEKLIILSLITLLVWQIFSARKNFTKNIFYFLISQSIILMLILPSYSWHHRFVLLLFVYFFIFSLPKSNLIKISILISFIFNGLPYGFYALTSVNSWLTKIYYNLPFVVTLFLYFILSFYTYPQINKIRRIG